MGSREDDEYWNTKYAEAECYEHGEDFTWYNSLSGEWECDECLTEDELNGTYNYG